MSTTASSVFALMTIALSTAHSAVSLQYNFTSNTADTSGSGNHGTIVGTAGYTTDRFGNENSALSVNTTSGVISTSYIGIAGDSDRTVTIWISPAVEPVWPNGNLCGWGESGNLGEAFSLQYLQQTNFLGGPANITFDAYYAGASVTTDPLNLTGQWHMLAFTYSQSTHTATFYLNGVPQTTNYTSSGLDLINTVDGFFRVNATTQTNPRSGLEAEFTRGMTGAIDDVNVYNTALSASEIAAQFALESQRTVPEPGVALLAALGAGFGMFRRRR